MKNQRLYDYIKYKKGIIDSIPSDYVSDSMPSSIWTDCSICHLTSFYVMDIMESCRTEVQLENAKNWASNITKNGTPFLDKSAESIEWWFNFINEKYLKNLERIKNSR